MMRSDISEERLWDRNFTSYSVSVFLAYLSNAGVSFVLSLLVLELTDSVLLYGAYLVLYYSANVFVPVLVGPFLENIKLKNVNGLCCLCMAAIYGVFYLLYKNGIQSMAFIFCMAIATGIINAVFYVSSNSLLLNIVRSSKLQKAYSIYSGIEIFSEVSVPIVTIIYKNTGLSAILLGCVPLFLVSALISVKGITQTVPEKDDRETQNYTKELREGLEFVKKNKAYLIVCIAFLLMFMLSGIRRTVWLPYFEQMSGNSYLWYFGVYSAFSTGIFHSSVLLYLLKIKERFRYALSIISFVFTCLGMVIALYCGNIVAVILAYFVGLGDGIFNNMRSVSVYANLDEKQRARFSGIFTAFTNAGLVIGMGLSGILSSAFSLPTVNTISGILIILLFLIVYLAIDRKSVSKLYRGDPENE